MGEERYYVQHGGREIEAKVTQTDLETSILIGKTESRARLHPGCAENEFLLHLDGKTYTANISRTEDGLRVEIDGYVIPLQVLTDLDKRVRAMSGGRKRDTKRVLKSEMPGVVKQVYVKAGQEVKAGDPLLILEAMKMENKIKAAGDGVIKNVHVDAGQQVAVQAQLITFE